MNDSIFTATDLRSTQMISCEARNLDFEKTNLSKASLIDIDLLNTTFANTNLSSADLTDAKNYRIDPTKNNIRKAKFSLPDVVSLLDQWDIEIK